MATASRENPRPAPSSAGGGLSLQTLVIASAGSVAAAVFTHMIWKAGAIVGAAITPIIVALVTETLKKPTQVVTAVVPPVTRSRRRGAGAAADVTDVPRAGVGGAPMGPPPTSADAALPGDPARAAEDRFGIWQADRRPWYERLKGRPMKIALATGALAFLIGAFALTGAELVFGGSVGGGGDRVTILPGKQKKSSSEEKDKTTKTTSTTETTETAPADEEPTETTPEQTETVPTVPEEQAPQTVPTTPQQTPAPQTTPAPAPAPAPGTETPPAGSGTEAPPAG